MPDRQFLHDVSLICFDTRHPDQACGAIERCNESTAFASTDFFCPSGWTPPAAASTSSANVVLHPIAPIRGIEDYNRFRLRGLADYVRTSHALVMQWDGFLNKPGYWSQDFLKWDYIGAPWYSGKSPSTVGNGGFSLRSRRLLDALATMNHSYRVPEDVTICINLRPELESRFGIRFAPLEVAQNFACEYGPYRPAFGFHGMHNFAHVLNTDELGRWLDAAPPEILQSQPARKLVKALMKSGHTSASLDLIKRRSKISGWTRDQCMLFFRAWAWYAITRKQRL